MVSGHLGEKAGNQCKMNGDFASLLIIGNRGRLYAYEVSKALHAEARLVQFTKKIVVGHGAIGSLFNEIKTHKNMNLNQKNPAGVAPVGSTEPFSTSQG
jgi:hypothetical protein